MNKPFSNILSGENAFYLQEGYLNSTKNDFATSKTLPVTYTWNTEDKIIRLAKKILSIIIFPIGIYQAVHHFVGKMIVQSFNSTFADGCRLRISLDGDWKFKRITIKVDGCKIDAIIMGNAETFDNGRWVLHQG